MTDPTTTPTRGSTKEPPPARSITDVLRDVGKGAQLANASERLRDVVAAVTATGKPGRVTITVDVKPAKHGDHLLVVPTVASKVPTHTPKEAVMFVDGTGNLTRHDPDQLALMGEDGDRA